MAGSAGFRLESYFDGAVRAWGLFQDRFGTVRRQFVVDIEGRRQGDMLVLEEAFHYTDGATEHRTWRIESDGPDRYVGRADGVVGRAEGRVLGPAVRWRYVFRLPVGGRTLRVNFDDWLYPQDAEIVIGRARVTKLGLRLGSVTLCFRRLPIPAVAVAGWPARIRQPVA